MSSRSSVPSQGGLRPHVLDEQPLSRRPSHLLATMQTGTHPAIQLLQLVHVHVLQPLSPQVVQQPAVKVKHIRQPSRHTAMPCKPSSPEGVSANPASSQSRTQLYAVMLRP